MKICVDLFNQHSGNLSELKRMALEAWTAGADCVKLQLLNSQRIWGDDSRKYLEMWDEDVYDFFNYCRNLDIPFTTTVFDEHGLEILEDWIGHLDFLKVASVTAAKDVELTKKIIKLGENYNKRVIISCGMLEPNEFPYKSDVIKYLWCISEYPTYLNNPRIKEMPENFDKYWGFSDHCVGIVPALKSFINGSNFLEKHYTANLNAQNTYEKAHLCSFDSNSLRQFKNLIREYEIIK